MRQGTSDTVKKTARKLRQEQTESERSFWKVLRNRQFLGKKFLRQHPITFEWHNRKRFFVADFYCSEARLVIELDGKIHEKQKDYDQLRDFVMKSLGIKVLRFNNKQIEQELTQTLKIVENNLAEIS